MKDQNPPQDPVSLAHALGALTGKTDPATNLPLAEMSQQERQLWGASHRLPSNMLLVSQTEMLQIRNAIQIVDTEAKGWRRDMKRLMGTEDPREVIKRIIDLRDRLAAHRLALSALDPNHDLLK